jgi:putative transposase
VAARPGRAPKSPHPTHNPVQSPSAFCDRLYDVEIRRVICTTNAIESINARYRRAVRARGHFPNEQSALKCLYLVTRSLDPTGGGRARWVIRWKPALNAFAITFADRLERATH